MKITITRGELKQMAAGLSKVIPVRTNLAVLACVRFAIEDGKLTATGTDLDQTAVFSFAHAQIEGHGELIIGFTGIKDMAKGDNADLITLENEGMEITVTDNMGGHAITRSMEAIAPADWPPSGDPIPVGDAKGFLKAYRRLAAFASTDDTRRTLCGVCIDTQGSGERNATLVATDGRRLCCCNSMKLPLLDGASVIIPSSKFLLWNGLGDEAELGVETLKGTTRICVKAGPWTYRVKAVDGEFPNWRQVIPASDSPVHRISFSEAGVKALLRLLPSFPGKEGVALEGGKDGILTLRSIAPENGKTLAIPLNDGSSYTGPGCTSYLSRDYLLAALNAGFSNFMFTDTLGPLLSDE